MNPEEAMKGLMAVVYDDPLGYVMMAFPWDSDPSIQLVELGPEYRARFGCKWGPDKWACEFLDELGEQIRDRAFDGSKAVKPIRFSTASGHGIGKSALVAWLIKFILDTRPYSKGVVTANTGEQLKTKTWAELSKWHNMSITKDLYSLTTGRGAMAIARKSDPGIWRCDAQTCREENAEAFQGLHAANSTPFMIFDEASGIPDAIWDARQGAVTDGEPMSFDFGNPTRRSGYFYENTIGKFKERFITRSIDSRSVTITQKDLYDEWAEDYGEDSDFFKVKVKGEFPDAGDVQFIPADLVRDAMKRPPAQDPNAQLIIGVDVARYGDNATVLYPRIGNDAASFPYEKYHKLDTVQVAGRVIQMVEKFRALGKEPAAIFIDGGGLGGGVLDQLRALGYSPRDVNFGGKPTGDSWRYKGDEMWGTLRSQLRYLSLPDKEELYAQLTAREYSFTATGKQQLESKEDMAKRGAASPDVVDALVLTYAETVAPRLTGKHPLGRLRTCTHQYDPIEYQRLKRQLA
jgi:hypothetical protein